MSTNFLLNKACIQILSVIVMGVVTIACADINASAQATDKVEKVDSSINIKIIAKLQANLKKSNVKADIKSVEAIGDSGLYWVITEGTPSFMTNSNGKYVIQGNMVEIGGDKPIDVMSKFENKVSKNKLAAVKREDMVIFAANPKKYDKPKSVIYAFTDSSCYYCRKLHNEMDELNDLGIEVRYLAWPRHPTNLAVAEAIWCSDDRNQAMTDAKQDKKLPMQTCDSPVVEQVQLGNELGIRGTPAIFNEEGKQLGGYLTPEQFVEVLNIK